MTLPISATTTQIHQKRVLCALVKRQLVSPFSILPSANLFQLHKATNIYKYIAKHLSTIHILNDDECLTGIRRTTTTNTTRDADLLLLVNTRYDHLFIFPQHQHHHSVRAIFHFNIAVLDIRICNNFLQLLLNLLRAKHLAERRTQISASPRIHPKSKRNKWIRK